jgi:hypothetical protein
MKPGSQICFREIVNVGMVLGLAWTPQDWFALGLEAHNAVVTITYPDGTVLQAIVLSHEEHAIRAIAAGCDDVLAFTSIHGTWISEEIEAVAIEFEWQRRRTSPAISEDDCVCPKELAARLIQTLLAGGERDEVVADTLYVFNPEGRRVAIH